MRRRATLRIVARDEASPRLRRMAALLNRQRRLQMNPFRGILIFSAIETLAVIVWAILAGIEATADIRQQVVAGVVFFVFFTVEHIIAFNVGKGRPLLSKPRP